MEVSVVGNLVLIDIFSVKSKVWSTGNRFALDVGVSVYHSSDSLKQCLSVTNPFESSCIRTSDWCWCRWVRTICSSLHLLLSAYHSVGGPVCWRFQDGGASAGSRPSPLSTRNASARQVPRCFGGSSRPGPRIHVHLRPEFIFWARSTRRHRQFFFWYVQPIKEVSADTDGNQTLWISRRKFEFTVICNATTCGLDRKFANVWYLVAWRKVTNDAEEDVICTFTFITWWMIKHH